MKKVLFAIVFLLSSYIGFSQCTPHAPTGNPGVTPPPDSIPCIERGVFYSQTMQIENFDTFTANIPILGPSDVIFNWSRIDSITNFPCGITWQASKDSLGPGETACIYVSGTTYDRVGQYPLKIYMTISLQAAGQSTVQSGEITSLLQQAQQFGVNPPLNLGYTSRVIEAGTSCPAIDPNANLTSAGANCPSFSVTITGNPFVCSGSPTTLTAIPSFNVGTVSYLWSPGGETTQSITVNTLATYSVVANDGSTTDSASQVVAQGALPVANFTPSGTGTFTFTNTSTGATSYAWNFGDNSSPGNTSTTTSPIHAYYSNGTYNVRLIATNACGSDTNIQQVSVSGLFCDARIATGNPGVTPPPDSIPCMERGTFYDQVMLVENYDSFVVQGNTIKINFSRIDSIKNFPCGISWEANRPDRTYGPGETGCIRVFGTTTDAAGQYPLEIYMTMNIHIPSSVPLIGGDQEASGEVNGLIQQLNDLLALINASLPFTPPNLKYVTRVIEQGGSCPAIDPNASLRGSGAICPPFSVSISGNTTVCPGTPTTLTATPANSAGAANAVTYVWSPGGATTQSINVTAVGTYSVVANDGSTMDTATQIITLGAAPTASFTSSNSGSGNYSFTSTSTGNPTSYSWDFGDPNSSSNTATTATANHAYSVNGSYNVRLIATSNCGSDTSVQAVNVVGVYIHSIKTDNVSMSLYPNPNKGTFELDVTTFEQNDNYQLRVFDVQGKIVYTEVLSISSNKIHKTLHLENLERGIYTISLNSGTVAYIQKLVRL